MALYLLELPKLGGGSRHDDVGAMVVEADSVADARLLASAQFAGDSNWSDATATTIATGVASDWQGFTYRVRIGGGAAQTVEVDVSTTGGAAATIDGIGAALVTALNATPDIANALYTGATNTLTAAAIADGIGDATLTLEVTPPGASEPVAFLTGAIVDQGAAGADLTVVLTEPTAIPAVLRRL